MAGAFEGEKYIKNVCAVFSIKWKTKLDSCLLTKIVNFDSDKKTKLIQNKLFALTMNYSVIL